MDAAEEMMVSLGEPRFVLDVVELPELLLNDPRNIVEGACICC